MKKLIKKYPLFVTIGVLGVSLFIFLLVDMVAGKAETNHGEIVDKYYLVKEARHGAIKKNYLQIRTDIGETIIIECPTDLYYRKRIGDTLNYKFKKGCFTNESFGYSL